MPELLIFGARIVLTWFLYGPVVEHYISHVLPLFPVVTPSDFAALNTLSPVTLMAACTVAALSRNHPFQFFSTVRALFTTTVSNSNVFEVSSLANIEVSSSLGFSFLG